MFKRYLAALLAMLLVVGLAPAALAGRGPAWDRDDAEAVLNGAGADDNKPVTRMEAAVQLSASLGLAATAAAHKADDLLSLLVGKGKGKALGHAHKPLTQLEALILLEAAGKLQAAAQADLAAKNARHIPAGVRGLVAAALAAGWFDGPAAVFQLNKPVTRAQWRAILGLAGDVVIPGSTKVQGMLLAWTPAAGATPATLTVNVSGTATPTVYQVENGAPVRWLGRAIALADLAPGDTLEVTVVGTVAKVVTLKDRAAVARTGAIESLNAAQRTFVLRVDATTAINVSYGEDVPLGHAGFALDAASLAAGLQGVTVTGPLAAGWQKANAIAIATLAANSVQFHATYLATAGSNVQLKVGSGAPVAAPVAPSAAITLNGNAIPASFLAAQDGVRVTLANGIVTALALWSRNAYTGVGTVASLDAPHKSFTFGHIPAGQTTAVILTVKWSNATLFKKAGADATSAALANGQVNVVVQGALKDGNTLEAALVQIP